MGLWAAAPYALLLLDILYPQITKTLCSFFSCRNLGSAGWYLEVDCTSDLFVISPRYLSLASR